MFPLIVEDVVGESEKSVCCFVHIELLLFGEILHFVRHFGVILVLFSLNPSGYICVCMHILCLFFMCIMCIYTHKKLNSAKQFHYAVCIYSYAVICSKQDLHHVDFFKLVAKIMSFISLFFRGHF